MAKTYAATYLYGQYSEYEKQTLSFMMSSSEIDKDTEDFDDIKYEVKKRQVSNSLVKVLEMKDVILLTNDIPLSKAFKVFCARDIKGPNKNKMKVFIDCSNIIKKDLKSGRFVCKGNNIDIFISYLVDAMITKLYYANEGVIISNAKIKNVGAKAFALLFTHVVDYACKINTMPSNKSKCMYLTSLYYLSNLLGEDSTTDRCRNIAKKISGLSDRDAGIVDIQLKADSFLNIKYFSETLSDILRLNKLTLDVIVERWMSIYGTGTVFALELFPAFSNMITDAYVGAYLNNQKTIEKVVGTSMTEFTKILLSIGSDTI